MICCKSLTTVICCKCMSTMICCKCSQWLFWQIFLKDPERGQPTEHSTERADHVTVPPYHTTTPTHPFRLSVTTPPSPSTLQSSATVWPSDWKLTLVTLRRWWTPAFSSPSACVKIKWTFEGYSRCPTQAFSNPSACVKIKWTFEGYSRCPTPAFSSPSACVKIKWTFEGCSRCSTPVFSSPSACVKIKWTFEGCSRCSTPVFSSPSACVKNNRPSRWVSALQVQAGILSSAAVTILIPPVSRGAYRVDQDAGRIPGGRQHR